ncbi:MAG: hypothetical protein AAGD96_08805, partial [Chloroflexota bacterium]
GMHIGGRINGRNGLKNNIKFWVGMGFLFPPFILSYLARELLSFGGEVAWRRNGIVVAELSTFAICYIETSLLCYKK